MGIRSMTPRKPCPKCGKSDTYAGTILTGEPGHPRRDIVRGAVRCNECDFELVDYWTPKGGETLDEQMLEKLVARWNSLDRSPRPDIPPPPPTAPADPGRLLRR